MQKPPILRFDSAAVWLAIASLVILTFIVSGCNGTGGRLFRTEQVQVGTVPQDSVQAPDGTLTPLTAETRATTPPEKVVRAGTPIMEEKISVAPAVQAVVKGVSYLPVPFADVASYGLNGALAIAALWLNRRKAKAEKVNESLVKGVDTFRDILDQTEGGAKLDAHLTRTLQNHQAAAGVVDAVRSLLDRFATSQKPHHSELTAAALKS